MPGSLPAKTPSVSIIVPNYNHARFLPQRLDSILTQTFADFELIILDDASSDNSCEIIAGYLTDPRVRFHPNTKNSGSPFPQWNRGVSLARGEFVWIAESDDFAETDFLAALVPILREQPKLGFVYCQSRLVDEHGKGSNTFENWTADLDSQRWKSSFVNDGRHECANFLIWKNTVPNASAVLLRRAAFLQAGGAAEEMRLCGDWMAWVRMLLISDVAFVPSCLNHFRKHGAAVRETTSYHKLCDEQWTIQLFIMRSCMVPVSAQRKVAIQFLNEFITQMREAPRSEKWPVFRHRLFSYWPIMARAPLTSMRVMVQRLLRFLKNCLA